MYTPKVAAMIQVEQEASVLDAMVIPMPVAAALPWEPRTSVCIRLGRIFM